MDENYGKRDMKSQANGCACIDFFQASAPSVVLNLIKNEY